MRRCQWWSCLLWIFRSHLPFCFFHKNDNDTLRSGRMTMIEACRQTDMEGNLSFWKNTFFHRLLRDFPTFSLLFMEQKCHHHHRLITIITTGTNKSGPMKERKTMGMFTPLKWISEFLTLSNCLCLYTCLYMTQDMRQSTPSFRSLNHLSFKDNHSYIQAIQRHSQHHDSVFPPWNCSVPMTINKRLRLPWFQTSHSWGTSCVFLIHQLCHSI